MRRLGGMVLVIIGLAGPPPVLAQHSGLRESRRGGSGGVTVIVAEPLGDFRRSGDYAAGLTLFGTVPLDRSGLALRIDAAYLVYDAEYQGYGVSTTSQIGTVALGPQVVLGRGQVRPYGFASFGGSLFWSTASDEGYCGCYDRDVFYLDGHFTTATQLGTGIQVVLSRSRRAVAIDLGVREMRHARVTYVPAGGITDNGDGTFTVQRVTTPVHLRVFQVGLSIGGR